MIQRVGTFLPVLFLSFSAGPVVNVPRVASPIVIDGRLDSTEWRQAVAQQLADGSMLRLLHDGRHLYIGIAPTRPGFPSVCIVQNDSVRILHASAALGAVTYSRGGGSWSSPDTAFTYGMRATDTTAAVREERRAYLARHGWVASTFRMSEGRGVEMQIALDEFDRTPRLAAGFFVTQEGVTPPVVPWPATLGATEGCTATDLVRGYVPRGLMFTTADWAELRLGS